MNNMGIEKEVKMNRHERMSNGQGAITKRIKKENSKEKYDQQRHCNVRK